MKKLNEKKIKWIVQEKQKGILSTQKIALTQSITPRRVRQIYFEFKKTGEVPILKEPGRKKSSISLTEVETILKAHERYNAGAVVLEHILKKNHDLKIPHNRIHRVLKENNRARDEPKKQQQRKWIRYERNHSMSLWHTDWKFLNDQKRWLIAYLDDASRMIMGYDTFDHATAENTIEVYTKAAKVYGNPRAVLTDRGTQFYQNEREDRERGISKFEQLLQDRNVKHIVGRVNHPQTNGKIERFFSTVSQKMKFFDSIGDFMVWYNETRPHMSLDWDNLETPKQAFYRKLYPDQLLGYVSNHIFRW